MENPASKQALFLLNHAMFAIALLQLQVSLWGEWHLAYKLWGAYFPDIETLVRSLLQFCFLMACQGVIAWGYRNLWMWKIGEFWGFRVFTKISWRFYHIFQNVSFHFQKTKFLQLTRMKRQNVDFRKNKYQRNVLNTVGLNLQFLLTPHWGEKLPLVLMGICLNGCWKIYPNGPKSTNLTIISVSSLNPFTHKWLECDIRHKLEQEVIWSINPRVVSGDIMTQNHISITILPFLPTCSKGLILCWWPIAAENYNPPSSRLH